MLIYRLLRAVNLAYPFLVFWLYLGAFVIALSFVFVFPPVALLLVFVCVLSIPFIFLTRLVLMFPQLLLARHALRKHKCPRCGEFVIDVRSEAEGAWHCVSCGVHYMIAGEEIELEGTAVETARDQHASLALE
jgi:predicted RNA-binding Zn-ribbon protein involved in translation (DUF1610 family)